MENLQKFLKNLNNTFGSITIASGKSYFPTTITRRLCDILWLMNILVSDLSHVPDIDLFDVYILNGYANEYETWLSIKNRLEKIEIKILKFNQDNWTPFKERIMKLCEPTIGARGIPLDNILSTEDRIDIGRIEAPKNIDVTLEYITKHVILLW